MRWKKKLLGKTTWFRKKRGEDDTYRKTGRRSNTKEDDLSTGNQELRTRAVIFVPQTPSGELAKRTREVIQKMEHLLKFKLKVVERAGTSLQNQFSQSSIWRGMACGRQECIPCHQEGEEIQNCTKTSLVYENICLVCNPKAANKGDLERQETDQPSLYVGESSRSLQERTKEHWGAYRRQEEGGLTNLLDFY